MEITTYKEILAYLRGAIDNDNNKFYNHVYSVGGCERDKYLKNRTIKDIDLVVDLPNGGIDFARYLLNRGLLTGTPVIYENFGTAMFHLKAFPNEEIEVVHTRKEIYRDKNSRNPETDYGSIQDDCRRRDFTINALYHNISTGEDLDLTGMGREDADNGIIRCCNEPNVTFDDDPLRIMRCIRFACRLGFQIEESTFNALKEHAYRLDIISQERITDELNKIMSSPNSGAGYFLMRKTGILEEIIPQCDWSWVDKLMNTRVNNTIMVLGGEDKLIAFLAIVSNAMSGDFVETLKNLKYPNTTVDIVKRLVKTLPLFNNPHNISKANVREAEYICKNRETLRIMWCVLRYFYKEKQIERMKDGGYCMCGYNLPLNGNDVMKICGILEGKGVRDRLDFLMKEAFKHPYITYNKCCKLLKKYDN